MGGMVGDARKRLAEQHEVVREPALTAPPVAAETLAEWRALLASGWCLCRSASTDWRALDDLLAEIQSLRAQRDDVQANRDELARKVAEQRAMLDEARAEVARLSGPFPCCVHCQEDPVHAVDRDEHSVECRTCGTGAEARALAAESVLAAVQALDPARILTVPSEEAMFDFLTALNVSGLHPEVPCSVPGGGVSFLAGLTEPDADHVHVTVTDADSGVVHCCECSHPGERPNQWDPNSWSPTYPVLALVTEWPDMERVADEDFIDPWWAPALATPTTTERSESDG